MLRHRTEGVYGRAAAAMRRGMCDVLMDPRGRLLGLYTPQELGVVIGGVQDVDVGEWGACTVYGGGTWQSLAGAAAFMSLANCKSHRLLFNHPTPSTIPIPIPQATPTAPRRSNGSGPWCAAWRRGRSAPFCSSSARAPRASPSAASRSEFPSI